MIANPITGEVQSLSTHPNDNWMGAPWLLVPKALEAEVNALLPFVRFTLDEDGSILSVSDDAVRRAAEAVRRLAGLRTDRG